MGPAMGVKISKRYSSYKLQPKVVKLTEFSSQWSQKNYVGDFWKFGFLILNNFVFSKISRSPV